MACLGLLVLVFCWRIWKLRNKCVFKDGFQWTDHSSNFVVNNLRDYIKHKVMFGNKQIKLQPLISWDTPPDGFLKLNVDGVATSNSGDLTIRGLCRDN